jgi:hypothetical protein
MRKIFSCTAVVIVLFSIALSSCKNAKHKGRPLAELVKQDSVLVKQNALLKAETDSILTFTGVLEPDSMDINPDTDSSFVLAIKTLQYKIKVVKEKTDDLILVFKKAQTEVLFNADNIRPIPSSNMMLKDVKNYNETEMETRYFYGSDENYKVAAAHSLKDEIGLFKLALKLSRDTLKIKPADTLWLNTADTAHDAAGKTLPWEAYNFDGATAAENYVLFDKLQNEALREYQATLLVLYKNLLNIINEMGPQGEGGC